MKLSWYGRFVKRCRIKRNRKLMSVILDVSIADCFGGKPKKTISGNRVHIKFSHVNVGIHKKDSFDNLPTWGHEFVEHVVGRLILEILVEDGFTLKRMRDIIRNGILIRGIDGGLYNPTMKHVIAALCTSSSINENIDASPEEFAEFFGFKNGPVAQLDSAAPFEGVRSRFEFGRGPQSKRKGCLNCKSNFWMIKNKCDYKYHKEKMGVWPSEKGSRPLTYRSGV